MVKISYNPEVWGRCLQLFKVESTFNFSRWKAGVISLLCLAHRSPSKFDNPSCSIFARGNGLGPVHRCDADTWPKLDTCHPCNGSSALEHWRQAKSFVRGFNGGFTKLPFLSANINHINSVSPAINLGLVPIQIRDIFPIFSNITLLGT